VSDWTCGPKCPCWSVDDGGEGLCRHPNFAEDEADYAPLGSVCEWELSEWVRRDGEMQDEIADLQQEQAGIRALIAARRAAEGEGERG
jgi:hypothetical protein